MSLDRSLNRWPGRSAQRIQTNLLLLLLLLIPLLSSCSGYSPKHPTAKQGVLDMRGWSWENDDLIPLRGQWSFHWNQLLPPDSLASDSLAQSSYLSEPGFWSDATNMKQSPPLTGGYATYHLRVLAPESDDKQMAIYVTQIASAFQVWVNGEPVTNSGVVGENSSDEVPNPRPATIPLPTDTTVIDVVIQLSDHQGWPAGHIYDASIGTYSSIRSKWRNDLKSGLLIVGALLIMALYHLALFVQTRNDRSMLWLSLLIFSFVLYYGSGVGTEVRWILFGKHQLVAMRWGIAAIILFPILFTGFTRGLFPGETPRWFLLASLPLFIPLWLMWVFFPGTVAAWAFILFRYFTLVYLSLAVVILLLAVLRKRSGAIVFAIGCFLLLATLMNDMLVNQGWLDGSNLSHYGMLAFIFAQSWALAIRSATAFRTVRAQSEELRVYQEHLQELVDARTKELETALDELNKSREAEREAIRLRTVSQLAATIAHEFNNPLAVVKMAIELAAMRNRVGEDPGIEEMFTRINDQVARMKELANNLLQLRELQEIDYPGGITILDLRGGQGQSKPEPEETKGSLPEPEDTPEEG